VLDKKIRRDISIYFLIPLVTFFINLLCILIAVVSNSFILIWFCIEIRTLSFIGLLLSRSMLSNFYVIKYLTLQAFSAIIFILFLFKGLVSSETFYLVMLVKLNSRPFRTWLKERVGKVSLRHVFWVAIPHKILPLFFLNCIFTLRLNFYKFFFFWVLITFTCFIVFRLQHRIFYYYWKPYFLLLFYLLCAMVLYSCFSEFLYKFIEHASTPSPLPPNPGRGNGLEHLCYSVVELRDHESRYTEPIKLYATIDQSQFSFIPRKHEILFAPGLHGSSTKYQISFGPMCVEKNAVSAACLESYYTKYGTQGHDHAMYDSLLYGVRDNNHVIGLSQEVFRLNSVGYNTVHLTPEGTSVLYQLAELETTSLYATNGVYKTFKVPVHYIKPLDSVEFHLPYNFIHEGSDF